MPGFDANESPQPRAHALTRKFVGVCTRPPSNRSRFPARLPKSSSTNGMEQAVPIRRGDTRTARRQVSVTDNRPARQMPGSAIVRMNAVGATVIYVVLMTVNLCLVVVGIVILVHHWDDDEVCTKEWRGWWRVWVLMLTARKVFTTPIHMVSEAATGMLV